MKTIRIYDAIENRNVAFAKNEKQAKTTIYALERKDRRNNDYEADRYIIIVGQSDRRINRLNKQARRAFELQEV